MNIILQINNDNYEGYLKLCDLKIKIIHCIYNHKDFDVHRYLMDYGNVDYGANTLEKLLNNVCLSYNECIYMGFSRLIRLPLENIIPELRILYEKMKFLLESYPYVDSEVSLDILLQALEFDKIDLSNYENVVNYLKRKTLMDSIDLFDTYDYKKVPCYKKFELYYVKK